MMILMTRGVVVALLLLWACGDDSSGSTVLCTYSVTRDGCSCCADAYFSYDGTSCPAGIISQSACQGRAQCLYGEYDCPDYDADVNFCSSPGAFCATVRMPADFGGFVERVHVNVLPVEGLLDGKYTSMGIAQYQLDDGEFPDR